jgi:hypothetical protein
VNAPEHAQACARPATRRKPPLNFATRPVLRTPGHLRESGYFRPALGALA